MVRQDEILFDGQNVSVLLVVMTLLSHITDFGVRAEGHVDNILHNRHRNITISEDDLHIVPAQLCSSVFLQVILFLISQC